MEITEIVKAKIRGTINLYQLKKDGLIVGENFNAQEGVIIDPGHCWLIEIGNNVTLAPRVHILAHDASMKKHLGYAKIGKVHIGNGVFIGAGSIVLPNVYIDDNTIIGAGSVVTHDLIGGGVYVGNPCTKICEFQAWITKKKNEINEKPKFGEEYKIDKISPNMKDEMKQRMTDIAYIV